ncbi:MAG: DUF3341 domain-containing protein [Isosphaeraceae bacterium]
MSSSVTSGLPPSGPDPRVAGVIGRFAGPAEVLAAAEHLRDAGFRRIDAFSPFPIHGMDDALGLGRSWLSWMVLIGGLTGAGLAWFLQWYTSAVDYPMIVAGKPFNSREAWVPITFEIVVLLSAFTAVFGMLALCGLPRLAHPVFGAPAFRRASDDGFFLAVESHDPKFDPRETPALLESLGGLNVALLKE